MQHSSCFPNPTTSMETAPVFSGRSFQNPAVQCNPLFFVIHAHFLLRSKSCQRRAHSFLNLSTWPTVHPDSSQSIICQPAIATSHLVFLFQPGSDHLSHKASFLHLGNNDIWGQMILCCGQLCPVHCRTSRAFLTSTR